MSTEHPTAPSKYKNDLVPRALRGERTVRTPIWLMRQAGRTDPEYIRVRDASGLTLEALFRHPELATEITLLPKRFGVDALILYQDILTPLAPMGADFVFAPGPVLPIPLETEQEVDALHFFDVREKLGFVPETLQRLQERLEGEMPVLGFAGAPFTLAVFALEGKSFGASAPRAMAFFQQHPEACHRLLDKLSRMTIDYLRMQIQSGAAAVQLFESAAFLVDLPFYRDFVLPYQQEVFEGIRGLAPSILFSRGWTDLDSLDAAGAEVLSLPAEISVREYRDQFGPDRAVQGNLDNQLLAHGTWTEIEAATQACVAEGEHRGHVFNLSHGLLRETPFDHVVSLVKLLHSISLG